MLNKPPVSRAGPLRFLGLCLAVFFLSIPARAGEVIAQHQGSNSPLSEGFSLYPSNGGLSAVAVTNDMGLNAWSVTSTPPPDFQAIYESGALTSSQLAAVDSQGFTMTMIARVVSGPVFNSTTALDSAASAFFFGTRRFDIELGLNSQGDTVAVLSNTVTLNGDGTFSTPGATFTLTGSGSTYHSFQLYENPTSNTADLYVDGVLRLTGYAGNDRTFGASGLFFGAENQGETNFNFVNVVTGNAIVPEPSSLTLLGIGGAGLLGLAWHRRRRHVSG